MSSMDIDQLEAGEASENFGSAIVEGNGDVIQRHQLIQILDGIENEVESLRKQAIELQDKRDKLHSKIDLLRSDYLASQTDVDPEEINFQLNRVNERLKTVHVSVETVRDNSQIESLHHLNNMIDEVIRFENHIEKRKKCLAFLNSCSSTTLEFFDQSIDKKFENHLLSCTLDDQKLIKRRLQALFNYMTKQMVSE